MKITFIRPNLASMRSSDAMQPLVFAVLAGLTPPEVELSLYDERLEPAPCEVSADLVAMTVETYVARNAYRIAAQFRSRGIPVVLGGHHPSMLPDEALEHADAVVIGDAEGVWPQVVRDARAGRLARVYWQSTLPSLEGLRPDYRIFAGKRYSPITLIQVGRGCRFACDFCSIHAMYGAGARLRPVDEVIREIERLQTRRVLFVDDNLLADVDRAQQLFHALIPLRIKWSCQASIDVCRHATLLRLMKQSGCDSVTIGFESLDPRNLRQMNKSWAIHGPDYATAIRALRDHGIMIYGTFVFGYDYDTVDSFDATVEFALENKFFLANFNPLTPMPGTPLYERLEREGRLLYNRWWLDADFRYGQAVFRPCRMSPEQLTEGCLRARRTFYGYRSMLSRSLDWKTNSRNPMRLGLFTLVNLISRREILRKQGLLLGSPSSQAGD